MRAYLLGSSGILFVAVVLAHCGGATETLGGGGGSDASVDGHGSSSSGGSSSGSSSSGSGSTSGGSTSSSGGSASSSGGSTSSSGGSTSSGSGGSTSSSGGSTSSSGGSTSSSGGSSSSGSSSGGPVCPACTQFEKCCNAVCVNEMNDPQNCGGCGTTCNKDEVCENGKCQQPPCIGVNCNNGNLCCGTQCCTDGQICCQMDGPVQTLQCFTPTASQPTCPVGCGGCVSDRNVKRDFEPVDPQDVLERVSRMPITTWSYTSDEPSVRHMGMMAQDFYGEFGLGRTDKAFNPVDAHGVEMAAIQALYERLQQQERRIDQLERENRDLRRSH